MLWKSVQSFSSFTCVQTDGRSNFNIRSAGIRTSLKSYLLNTRLVLVPLDHRVGPFILVATVGIEARSFWRLNVGSETRQGRLCVLCTKCTGRKHYGLVVPLCPSEKFEAVVYLKWSWWDFWNFGNFAVWNIEFRKFWNREELIFWKLCIVVYLRWSWWDFKKF
jgi:hypothetical protein